MKLTLKDLVLSLLRIASAWAFLLHGTAKFLQFPIALSSDMPALFSLMWFAGILEIVGGIFLLLGLFSRFWGFLLSGQMAYAYFFVHVAHKGSWLFPIVNGGEAAMLFCFIFLYIATAGGGSLSLDRLLRGRS